jgi:hypothetical protein
MTHAHHQIEILENTDTQVVLELLQDAAQMDDVVDRRVQDVVIITEQDANTRPRILHMERKESESHLPIPCNKSEL